MANKAGPPAAALKKFRDSFAKSFGEDAIKSYPPDFRYDVIPTGSVALDYALGVGGFVRGRLVELWGPEQLGKSTQCLITSASAQRVDRDALTGWIDVEHTYDPAWAEAHGVDTDRMVVVQPDNAEDVADILKQMTTSGLFNMITLDSVGAMISRIEKEKDAEEVTMGIVPKIVTRMVKIGAAEAPKCGAVLPIINQVRASLAKFGPDTTRGGGFALGHVTTHRLLFRRGKDTYKLGKKTETMDSTYQVGQQVSIIIEKNKVAVPKRVASVTYFNTPTEQYGPVGIDRAFDAFTMGNQVEVFGRRGSWYDLPDGSKHKSKDEVLAYLRSTPSGIDAIREKVLATVAHEVVQEPMQEG